MRFDLINLERSPDRLERFLSVNKHLENIVRFPALDGANLDRAELVGSGTIAEDLAYNPGALGCAMSHMALWRSAIERGCAVTVAEDDAVLARNFEEKAEALLASLPAGWDFVMWGYHMQFFLWVEPLPGMRAAEIRWEQDRHEQMIEGFQERDIEEPRVMRLLSSFGIPCYTISPSGARSLLQHCQPLTSALIPFRHFPITIQNQGIDCAMNGWYPECQAWACVPPLAVPDTRLQSTIR